MIYTDKGNITIYGNTNRVVEITPSKDKSKMIDSDDIISLHIYSSSLMNSSPHVKTVVKNSLKDILKKPKVFVPVRQYSTSREEIRQTS